MANINMGVDLPDNASGLSIQLLAGTVYWSFEEMTDVDQGFKLPSGKEKIWVHPVQTPTIYLYGDGTVVYQPLTPQTY